MEIPPEPPGTCKAAFQVCAHCSKGPSQIFVDTNISSAFYRDTTLNVCSRCHCAYFCDKECLQKAWPVHKLACQKLINGLSPAIEILKNTTDYTQIFLSKEKSSSMDGVISPILSRCGIPLYVSKVTSEVLLSNDSSVTDSSEYNSVIRTVMIEPITGRAAEDWQQQQLHEKSVIIYRKDTVPVTPAHLTVMKDFIQHLLEKSTSIASGEIAVSVPSIRDEFLNHASFLSFLIQVRENQKVEDGVLCLPW